MKVLVIDDSSTMRLLIARALKELGHEVIQAGDGKAGLETARATPGLAIMLVDWNMPEMNGLEFVIAARSDAALKAVPIIMVTTENEAASIEKALQSGANEFILKPFTKDTLREKMSMVVPA